MMNDSRSARISANGITEKTSPKVLKRTEPLRTSVAIVYIKLLVLLSRCKSCELYVTLISWHVLMIIFLFFSGLVYLS